MLLLPMDHHLLRSTCSLWVKVEVMAPAILRACHHLKGEMPDLPSAFSSQVGSWTSFPSFPRAVEGQEEEVSIQGQGEKCRKASRNSFHKQRDSWNSSRLKICLSTCAGVLWIGKGWGTCNCPQLILRVLSFKAAGCQDVWVWGARAGGGAGWVPVAGSQERHKKTHKILWQLPKLEIFLSVFSGKARKYLLQKTVNWFFYEALLCQIQGLEIMIKVNRHFNLLCIQSLIQFQFQPHHEIIQT